MPGRAGGAIHGGDPDGYLSPEPSPRREARGAEAPHNAAAALVKALARAVQAFHTYPTGSPTRRDVADAVRQRVSECVSPGEPGVRIDVTSEGLRIAGETIPSDRGPERALAATLRKAYVASLEIESGVPARDIQQFCSLVAFPDRLLRRKEDLPEILGERGVQRLVVQTIRSHQTVDASTVPETMLELIRRRREAGVHLPNTDAPEGGWIRLDPSVALDRVTLDELPMLLRDAPALGIALHQVSGHDRDELNPHEALAVHYEEISELYSSCDPAVANVLFQRLAEVVRDLPVETRRRVLKEQVLPGLLDGRRGGSVLGHFPDDELAEALSLLVDLGVGGVEMLSAGLAKLEIPDDRLPAVMDHISRRLEKHPADGPALDTEWLDGLAGGGRAIGRRLEIESGGPSDFRAFRSLDLTVDEASSAELSRLVQELHETDAVTAALRFCSDILALSANPPVVASAMRASRGLFFTLESRGDVAVLAAWLARYATIAADRDEHDPEVSAIIRQALDQYVTPEFVHRVSALEPEDAAEPPLVTIICALGATGVAVLIESLAVESDRGARSRLLAALQPRAADLAEHLVAYRSHPEWYVIRNVLTLLGHAGPGWENPVLEMVDHDDARVVREAFLALARIGTPEASEHTFEALTHPDPIVRRHASDTVWRYSSCVSRALALRALEEPGLARLDPGIVRSLLHGAHQRRMEGLAPLARHLRRHLFVFWKRDRRSLGLLALRVSRAGQ